MHAYLNTKGMIASCFVGVLIFVGTLGLACKAAGSHPLTVPKRIIPHATSTEIVNRGATHPSRYNLWDKANGICSNVVVIKHPLPDGRILEKKQITSFSCTETGRYNL